MSPDRFPGHPRGCHCQRKANASQPTVKFLLMSDTRFAVFETLPILFDGRHSLRIHHRLACRRRGRALDPGQKFLMLWTRAGPGVPIPKPPKVKRSGADGYAIFRVER
jgi:hypothetical protein